MDPWGVASAVPLVYSNSSPGLSNGCLPTTPTDLSSIFDCNGIGKNITASVRRGLVVDVSRRHRDIKYLRTH